MREYIKRGDREGIGGIHNHFWYVVTSPGFRLYFTALILFLLSHKYIRIQRQ